MIVDPSHAAGKRDLVAALALAGMAAGAHGVIVEVHYNPAEAQCDGPQALLPETFKELMGQLRQIAAVHEERVRRDRRAGRGLNEIRGTREVALKRRRPHCRLELFVTSW